MRNIHLLPTDKPSRLVKLKWFGKDKLHLCKEILPIQDEEQYQNICITSEEEIKEGDYVINNLDKLIGKSIRKLNSGEIKDREYSKIILTTNPDLIEEGVQAIDNEFLEWFVKNPSCERVEFSAYHVQGDISGKLHYKIIIPQEATFINPLIDKTMKNVHILPTDKPSRLAGSEYITNEQGIDKRAFKLKLWNKIISNKDLRDVGYIPQNIYITSNEKIKEGDRDFYILANDRDGTWINRVEKVIECKIDPNHGKVLILSSGFIYIDEGCKIILTDNPDLITEGVQPINDKFLEWFVKNPSCEFVDVVKEGYKKNGMIDESTSYRYKIIIPQEEPKQYPIGGYAPGYYSCACVTCKTEFMGDKLAVQCEPCAIEMVSVKTVETNGGCQIEEPKQETLEEAAKDTTNKYINEREKQTAYLEFIEGAIWKAERSQMIVPPDATNIEVFAIKPDENGKLFAYIGYKISNGNFEFSTVPFTEPKPERMYSEEEVRKIAEEVRWQAIGNPLEFTKNFEKWFEQFKKK